MKNIIWIAITISFILLSLESSAQYRWEWAKARCSNTDTVSGMDEAWSVATDHYAHVYGAGSSNGNHARFDTFNYVNSYGTGNFYIYLVKYDTSGAVKYSKFFSSGHCGYSWPSCIVTAPNGSVYLSGSFLGDTINIDHISLSSAGGSQSNFIAKFDSSGNVIWAKTLPGSGELGLMALDHSGHLYYANEFGGDSIVLGHDTLRNRGMHQIYWAKLDTNGHHLWAKGTDSDTTTSMNFLYGLTVDVSGNLLFTGSLMGKTYLDTATYATTYSAAYSRIFVAKYDSLGNRLWVKTPGGVSHYSGMGMSTGWYPGDAGKAIAVDSQGFIYCSGNFSAHHIYFDNDTLYSYHEGHYSMYLSKFDPSGNTIWAKRFPQGLPYTMLIDSVGQKIWISGQMWDSIAYFDTFTAYRTDTNLFRYNASDGSFIAQFDSSGFTKYVSVMDRGGDDNNGIAVDDVGNIYFCGDYVSNYYGDGRFIFGNDTLPVLAGSSENFFIAKLAGPWVRPTDTTHTDTTHHLGLSYPIRKDLLIYPNPNNGIVTIEYAANCEVAFYDVTGRVLLRAEISTDKQVLNISALPMGVYAVDIIDKATGTKVVQKLLKE